MSEAPLDLICDRAFLAVILLVAGLCAHRVIRLTERLIGHIKRLDHDLYRAILFPYRQSFEADITGLSALVFYPRFMKAILSGDFTELEGLRGEHNRIAACALVFVVAVLCVLAWTVYCQGTPSNVQAMG